MRTSMRLQCTSDTHTQRSCDCGCAPLLVLASGENTPAHRPGPLARGFVLMVRFYQRFISPLTPPACRFTPSCSEYMRQSLIRHGAFRGTYLGTMRLLRCHPFHPGGHDPVP